jgi:hypothetical protein
MILTSLDGMNWGELQRQEATTNSLSAIAFGDGQFVAVGEDCLW